tara:strand:+ start:316 stop:609 length:294 start_codon:yes stop_codon:yes gene_type:complete
LKINHFFLGYVKYYSYVSTVIEREMMMKNVKELLKSWKHDLAHADGLMGTDYETLNEEQYETLSAMVEELEEAIEKDNNTIGKWEVVGEQTKHNLKF